MPTEVNYMSVIFDGKGFKAEKLCVKQFNGTLLSAKSFQYRDIDCYVKNKKGKQYTASVKDQTYSMKQGYDTIQIELKQTNTRNNSSIQGCFRKNESDLYFWLVWYEGKAQWFLCESKKLKKYVDANLSTLRTWTTSSKTEEKNRNYRRTYDRSEGVMINMAALLTIGALKPLEGQ